MPVGDPERIGLDRAVSIVRGWGSDGRRRVLGLTGPPGCGKSTVSAALVAALPPGTAVVLPMDGYHLAQAELERLARADRKGAPDTFDAAGFVALLRRVAAQHPPGARPQGEDSHPHQDAVRADAVVYAPLFRREIEEPIAGAIPIAAEVALVIVEGNYLLLTDGAWAGVRPLLDACWYVDPPDDVRLERLIARHIAHGRTPEAARAWVFRSDEANARVIARTRHRADLLLDPDA